MARENRKTPKTEQPAPNAARWSRFDALARWLLLIAFCAFAVVSGMNLRLVQRQLERLDERIEEREQRSIERDYWRLTREGTNPELRTEAFLRLVAADNKQWVGTNLKELDLDKASLNGAWLQFAQFSACSMKKAKMQNVEMLRGGFELCDMVDADLRSARLAESSFFRCIIVRTDFRRANLKGANFEQSRLKGANFENAEMSEASLHLAVLEDCDFEKANLTSANLTQAKIRRTDLRNAILYNAVLASTDFKDSNWWRARGLPSRIVTELSAKFPPSEDAPKEFREDWELWLKTGGASATKSP